MTDWSRILMEFLGPAQKSILPPRVKLPVLPHAAMEFAEKSRAEKVSAKELGQVIETDGGLTVELLKQVNSAAFGLRRRISTAAQAIALLGLKNTRLLVLTVAVNRTMKARESRVFNLKQMWTTNLERGLFAREVARLMRADPDVAFAGAMLQDFLLPILGNELTEDYVCFLARLRNEDANRLDQLERERFKWDHAAATGQVLRSWSFPDDLTACVALHHRDAALTDQRFASTAVAAVAIAGLIPDPIRQNPNGLLKLIDLDQSWKRFDLASVAARVDAGLVEFEAPLANHIPLSKRVAAAAMAT